jgi:alpha-tubulin suppressor-like RCC1 family protein
MRILVSSAMALFCLLPCQRALAQGTVWDWGSNASGQLGNGTNTASNTPVAVSVPTGVTAIAGGGGALGYGHSLALKSDGTVWAWGNNAEGQLGNGTICTTSQLCGVATPAQVIGLTGVTAIAAGDAHSLALKSDGTVWAWGNNASGQLGNGTFCTPTICGTATPVQVSGLTNVTAIASGAEHSLALTSDGTVWAWGQNTQGQLGNGTTGNGTTAPYGIATPGQVSGLTGVTAIAGGGWHNLALTSNGTVWAWGLNREGQLGNGIIDTTYPYGSNTPVQASVPTGVTAIAGGYTHSLALKSNGTVWAWGENDYGELGNGTYSSCTAPPCGIATPAQVSGLTGMTAIAGGAYHSLASNGTVWAWGANSAGQLGNGTNNTSNIPVAVSGLTGVAAIAGGGFHSLALVIQTITVTVNTAPTGQSFTVDGTTYTTAQTFHWAPGSSHTLATSSPQGSGSTQYVFQSWSDGGAASHTVTATSALTTFTANFTKQDYLTTAVGTGGSAAGSISPASGFFNEGTSVPVTATAKPGYAFTGFSGDLSGLTNPQTIAMNAQHSVTANFQASVPPSVIGTVTVTGMVTDGAKTVVNGDSVSQNDTIVTSPGSQVTITFIDGAVVTLSGNSELKLDEYVYNPNTNQGHISSSLPQGGLEWTSGRMVHATDNLLNVAYGVLGIRGTHFFAKYLYSPGGGTTTGVEVDLIDGTVDITPNRTLTTTTFTGPITIVFDGSSATASPLLNNLVNQFVTDPGVAQSLLAKLEAAQASAARGDVNSMDGQLGAFINAVSAQSGKTLTAAQANILIQVATTEMK